MKCQNCNAEVEHDFQHHDRAEGWLCGGSPALPCSLPSKVLARHIRGSKAYQAVVTIAGTPFEIGPPYVYEDHAEDEAARFVTAFARAVVEAND